MPFERHTVDDFLKHDEAALMQKRFFANLCIRAAKEAQEEGDPRAGRALEHYRAERKAINGALLKKRYGAEGPPDQTVHLKPLDLRGEGYGVKRDHTADEWEQIMELAKQMYEELMEEMNDGGR